LIALCRATQRYVKRPERHPELRQRLRALAEQRRRFGYRRLHTMLEREGVAVNVKRVRRLYREEGLSLRQRRGRRRYRGVRVVLPLPKRINQRWSMDFMTDALADGRRFRVLNVVDDFSRECLASEAGRQSDWTACGPGAGTLGSQTRYTRGYCQRQRIGILQSRSRPVGA
jgi:putative transposase